MKTTRRKAKHPIQPLIRDPQGITRFKKNAIVCCLLDEGNINLNHLAVRGFSAEDREQFAQLIGYSLSGFGELSYVTNKTYDAAAAQDVHIAESGTARKRTL
jgi:hypothetical protein